MQFQNIRCPVSLFTTMVCLAIVLCRAMHTIITIILTDILLHLFKQVAEENLKFEALPVRCCWDLVRNAYHMSCFTPTPQVEVVSLLTLQGSAKLAWPKSWEQLSGSFFQRYSIVPLCLNNFLFQNRGTRSCKFGYIIFPHLLAGVEMIEAWISVLESNWKSNEQAKSCTGPNEF